MEKKQQQVQGDNEQPMFSFKSYQPAKPSLVTRFLWWLSGVDEAIIKRAMYSEHVKYVCMGSIILGTVIMASLSMGFAAWIVFHSWIISITMGMFWGYVIGGVERFIVSSTGIGDGTSDIHWKELLNAIPRMALSILIGIVISAPLELFIFHHEIKKEFNKKVSIEQKKAEKEFDKSEEVRDIQRKIEDFQKEKDRNDALALENDRLAANENKTENGGCGPKCTEFKERADRFRVASKADADSMNLYMAKKNELRKKAGEKQSIILAEEPGLLEQLTLLHTMENAHTPTLFVTLFFIMVDLAPVLFKLMLSVGSYLFLSKMTEQLLLANHGIEMKEGYTKVENEKGYGEGKFLGLTLFHEVTMANRLKRKALDIKENLSKQALDLYKKKKSKEVKTNPMAFIKEEPEK
ncbi:MAG: DUF4407 domain-containing protein [Spirosomataceae bacterium]